MSYQGQGPTVHGVMSISPGATSEREQLTGIPWIKSNGITRSCQLKAKTYESDRHRMINRITAFLSLEDIAVVFVASAWICASPSRPALARSSSDNKLSSTSSVSEDEPIGMRGDIRMLSKEEDAAFLRKDANENMSV